MSRRHSIESNGSVLMEFVENQRIRDQQIQSESNANEALETTVATIKGHNPSTAAVPLHEREHISIELRQRVRIDIVFFY